MATFISHFQENNQISADYAFAQLLIIFIILAVFVGFTFKEKGVINGLPNNFLTVETSKILKGIATLFLVFGHFSKKCIEGELPFELAGQWAVIIFLFLSGFGLAKTYGLLDLKKKFIMKRVKRLLFPVWITSSLFFGLDYFLLDRSYEPKKIIFNFFGLISAGPPNGPAWFITYILYLYIIYYLACLISNKIKWKIFYLTVFSYVPFFIFYYIQFLNKYDMWGQYSVVFPLGVVVGIYNGNIMSFINKYFNKTGMWFFLIIFFIIFTNLNFIKNKEIFFMFPSIIQALINTFIPVWLVLSLICFSIIIDSTKKCMGILYFLGEYSFEIYLLHMPFMVYYDFFLFRKPLFLWFYIYFGFILIISTILKKISSYLTIVFFGK